MGKYQTPEVEVFACRHPSPDPRPRKGTVDEMVDPGEADGRILEVVLDVAMNPVGRHERQDALMAGRLI